MQSSNSTASTREMNSSWNEVAMYIPHMLKLHPALHNMSSDLINVQDKSISAKHCNRNLHSLKGLEMVSRRTCQGHFVNET